MKGDNDADDGYDYCRQLVSATSLRNLPLLARPDLSLFLANEPLRARDLTPTLAPNHCTHRDVTSGTAA